MVRITWRLRSAVAALAMLAIAASANAQRGLVRGSVASSEGVPIGGVDVTLDEATAKTRTDERGTFSFADVAQGVHVLKFRRIGFMPALANINAPTASPVSVIMIRTPPMLDTIKSNAEYNVLAGVVVDGTLRPIPGATVDLMGTGQSKTMMTDSAGRFSLLTIHPGPVVFRARKRGYWPATMSVRLDGQRGVVLILPALPDGEADDEGKAGFGHSDEYLWTETRERLAQRSAFATVVTRDALEPLGRESLLSGLAHSRVRGLDVADLERHDRSGDLCVILNGSIPQPNGVGLDAFAADEVDYVEVYPKRPHQQPSDGSGTLKNYAWGTCSSSFYVVVWLKKDRPGR